MVRGSFSFPEPALQIGVKMDWRAVHIELLSKYHFRLGFTPQLLLTIPLSK